MSETNECKKAGLLYTLLMHGYSKKPKIMKAAGGGWGGWDREGVMGIIGNK